MKLLLPTDIDQDFAFECTVPETEFFIGASLDGIPALTDPQLVPTIDPGTAHLFDYLKGRRGCDRGGRPHHGHRDVSRRGH